MNTLNKLRLLSSAAQYETAEDVGSRVGHPPGSQGTARDDLSRCIAHATLPGGRRVPILKTLVSSACENNCPYCAFRSGRDTARATFSPDELAALSHRLWKQGLVQGIFLSSGVVGGGPRTQDTIIATAEILRRRYRYRGFLHLKVMPGAEYDQVAETVRWADRVSVNLEAPNPARLSDLAPDKEFSDHLLRRLRWADQLRRSGNGDRSVSLSTQFVIGAVGESDLELLTTSAYLYSELRLARTYFSGFRPVPDTPLENRKPAERNRERRLYQASFLLRDYGFEVEDLACDREGRLPLEVDPKLAWARENLRESPTEINTADRRQLLRIPGIGPKTADRILAVRRQGRIKDLRQLSALGLRVARAAPFVIVDGRAPARQLTLWPRSSAVAGAS